MGQATNHKKCRKALDKANSQIRALQKVAVENNEALIAVYNNAAKKIDDWGSLLKPSTSREGRSFKSGMAFRTRCLLSSAEPRALLMKRRT